MSKNVHTSGKRKQAIARATLSTGNGNVHVNGRPLEHFEPKVAMMKIQEPLMLAGDMVKKLNINVKVFGGGWSSQSEAVRLAIGRGLVEINKSLKKTFQDYDRHLLVGDVRRNEPCKPNDSKPRAKRQKSYR
ncbi:MAG: 30S ribosomal protein S9 [archaeon]